MVKLHIKPGNGPINPKVVDPLSIKDGKYRLEIIGDYNSSPSVLSLENGAKWKLTNLTTGQIIASEKSINEINEQIIYREGFSISVNQVGKPGEEFDSDNGAIGQTFEYADINKPNWWNAVPAFQGIELVLNEDESEFFYPFVNLDDEDDPQNALSTMDEGHFIPLKSTRWMSSDIPYITPGWKGSQGFAIVPKWLSLAHLNNVDLVLTADKSKWSKCIVVESAVTRLFARWIGYQRK